jgi:hypothetical protein
LPVTDAAFRVHRAVEHFSSVVGFFRKRQRMRQLFLIEIQRFAVSRFVLANIGDLIQPPGRRFVHMLETGKRAAVEQVALQIEEGLHFHPGGVMVQCKRFIRLIAASAFVLLADCGSGTNKATPPPSGSFGDGNLKGTYIFSVSGSDINGNLFALAGTFTADGEGGISGGIIDLNNSARGPSLAQSVTRGSYSVGVDGRPTSTSGLLNLRTNSSAYSFDYVLSSSQHGLITEFDSSASGSGTLDLQSDVVQSNLAGQSFVFNLTGTSGLGTGICGFNTAIPIPQPFSTVGAFTLDGSGNITSGLQDFNGNCISSGATNLQISSGSVSLASNPGTATLVSSVAAFHFDVFPVDATHLKFIETDSVPIMAGDVFLQSPDIPSGNNVFTLTGFDSINGGPFTAAGILDSDGSGNINSDSIEDINDAGAASTISGTITGSYTDLNQGRSVLSLTGFDNRTGGQSCSRCQFAAYPSIGGLQVLEIDDGGMTTGVAYPQTATSVASSQGFGMNLSGSNSSGEEDDIAEFVMNNNALSGLIDFNDQGATSFAQRFSATYAPDDTAPGRGTVTSPSLNLVTYVVDSSTVVFVEVDKAQVGLGSLNSQTTSAKANLAVSRLALSPRPLVKSASQRR